MKLITFYFCLAFLPCGCHFIFNRFLFHMHAIHFHTKALLL